MFDMDKQVNHRVKEALIKIKGILNECGIETKNCTWDPWYKGIDDYLLVKNWKKEEQKSHEREGKL